jgi:hypothetical protein
VSEPVAVVHPWDRLPGESRQAYAAFCFYMDLPSNVRTLEAAFSAMLQATRGRTEDAAGNRRKMPGRWRTWSQPSNYNWSDRAAARDAAMRQEADRTEAEEVRRTARDRAARRLAVEESEWKARDRLIALAERLLEFPLETLEEVDDEPEERADGVYIIRRIIHRPIRWSLADVGRFYELASKLGRLSTGAETDRAAVVLSEAEESGRARAGGALLRRMQSALATADPPRRERLLEIYGRVLRITRELEDALIQLETGTAPPRLAPPEEEEEDF